MKVLFIGGNGNISWWCVQKALDLGYEVWELNRSATLKTRREIQSKVHKLTCDIHNIDDVNKCLENEHFDCICDFICFNELHAKEAFDVFKEKTNQFIFISSEAVYKRKTSFLPFTENTEQYNPDDVCPYIRGKINAEQFFKNQFENRGFPLTIVRPAYTYDVIVPTSIGQNCFTAVNELLHGNPCLIAGDGINLCTFTHSSDFAKAFVHLIGNKNVIGEDYQIASDEWLTWNDATQILLNALKLINTKIIHIPYTDAIDLPFFEKDLMIQKTWHNIYDCSKIKTIAKGWKTEMPFYDGIKQSLAWLFEKEERQRINPKFSEVFSKLYSKYK